MAVLFSVLISFFNPSVYGSEEKPNLPDLDVTYIEMVPRYKRYIVDYPNDIPTLRKGTENQKKWPDEGERIKFNGIIRNSGNSPISGSLIWLVDGETVKKDTFKEINPGEEIYNTLDWSWQGSQAVKLLVSPDNGAEEITDKNNSREFSTKAIALRINVEDSVYEAFNNEKNLTGSYSFEDWVNAHIDALNHKFSESGVLSTVRPEFTVRPDGSLPRSFTHAPEEPEWDGQWGFETTEWCQDDCKKSNSIQYWASKIQPSLLHEWAHQLGHAHNTDTNVSSKNNSITNQTLFPRSPDIFSPTGDELQEPFLNNSKLFTPYSVQALNSNFGYRRGYYADYLFDIPSINVLRIKDTVGNTLSDAQIRIWQSQGRMIKGDPILTKQTDSNGELVLPKQKVEGGTILTATNHILEDNPFGKVNVNGGNGMFLIETTSNGQKDYQSLSVQDFNLQYWQGNSYLNIMDLPTSIYHGDNEINLVLNKPTYTNTAFQNTSFKAVDGDKTGKNGYWQIDDAHKGDYLIIDLQKSYPLTKIVVWGETTLPAYWFGKFTISISDTEDFKNEEIVAYENDWYETIRKGKPQYLGEAFWVYPLKAAEGRYVKFTFGREYQQLVTVQEIEIFGIENNTAQLELPEDTSFYRLINNDAEFLDDRNIIPTGPSSCSESEYDEFAGCSETTCGYEKWICQKNGDVREFPNQLGDCASACTQAGPVQPEQSPQCDAKNWTDEEPYSCENGWACYNRWKITGGASCNPEPDYGEDGNWYICKEDSECGTPQAQDAE